jgi:hypothetical protein
MSAVISGWLGFAALGAGLVHVALAIDSPPVLGIPLVVVGAAEFAWGVFAVTTPGVPLARTARVAALVPILGWAALLVVGAAGAFEGLRVLPMLVASLLDLAIAVGITWILRRDPAQPVVPLRPGRYLLGLGAGALVITALTTLALAGTEAGAAAIPHGTDEPLELILPGTHGGH